MPFSCTCDPFSCEPCHCNPVAEAARREEAAKQWGEITEALATPQGPTPLPKPDYGDPDYWGKLAEYADAYHSVYG